METGKQLQAQERQGLPQPQQRERQEGASSGL